MGWVVSKPDVWCGKGIKTLGGIKFDKQWYLKGKNFGKKIIHVWAKGVIYSISYEIADKKGISDGKLIYIPFKWLKIETFSG
jgi:hypothetical protein